MGAEKHMIKAIARMPRGVKPESSCMLFGTTQEHDLYVVEREYIQKKDYWYHDSFIRELKNISEEVGFLFTKAHDEFHARMN